MNSPLLSLVVLAAIAVFLILRLRSVLGTREGFEKPVQRSVGNSDPRRSFEVIEGGVDRDITDHVEDGSESAQALAQMKGVEPGFAVSDFLSGARGAYEMILMAFERGEIDEIREFLDDDVAAAFDEVVASRAEQKLTIDASFIGVRELTLSKATFDDVTRRAEVTVRFVAEMTSTVRNAEGAIVEGDPNEIKRQRDVWTFARTMGSDDPNWVLVATDG